MDPRQPQGHPFSRNSASQYGRSPFPPTSTQPSYLPTAPLPRTATFPDHQRRPSDPAYYNQQRSYPHEPQAIQGNHSRHGSISSLGRGAPGGRGMPPPNSPQQQGPPHNGYGPISRTPSLNGPPPSFVHSRDLPSLPSLSRAPSAAAMSIHSVLGGPSSASASSSHYPSPSGTAAPPNTAYPSSHPSPRNGADYAPFRRPHTPDYPRAFDSRDRANSAGSPSASAARFSTPEARRYGTPQSYASRPPPAHHGPFEDRRDSQGRGPTSMPPRPSSQPNGYHMQPSRAPERASIHSDPMYARRSDSRSRNGSDTMFGRRPDAGSRDFSQRPEMNEEQRFYEEERNSRLYEERENREREAAHFAMMREREQRESVNERMIRERRASFQGDYGHQMAPQTAFGRGPEVREPQSWRGPAYEARPPYDQHDERPPQTTSAYGPPSHYPPQSAPAGEPRYGAPASIPQPGAIQVSPYEASIIERQRQAQQERMQQQAQQQAYGPTSHPQTRESPPRRQNEEAPPMQQSRSLLGPGEMNRKGRASPLPQAVQGAQIQQAGPAGEPHIKNEFGRMFSGIGSGVGGMGVSSPVSANAPGVPFSNPNQARRENLESLGRQDSPTEMGPKIPREASRGGRRKKLIDEDREDESSTGRVTPSGRGKRPKLHHHHSHHHHHHHHGPDSASPSNPNPTPFRNHKGSAIPSPPGQDREGQSIPHHHIRTHHHHHAQTPRSAPPQNTIIPYHKTIVRNQVVLDSVSHLPRHHLGHTFYERQIQASTHPLHQHDSVTFIPKPLPRFDEDLNCTFTVKIPSIYLTPTPREDVTKQRALWGTDIYTDDSDIIAACIHSGWFRGKWAEDIDVSLLNLEVEPEPGSQDVVKTIPPTKSGAGGEETWFAPPVKGPIPVPRGKDCHVTILTLPTLQKYAATTRWGIRSRDWGGHKPGYRNGGTVDHDGVSFMITSVRWCGGEAAVDGQKGVDRRKRLARETQERREAFGRDREGDVKMVGVELGEGFESGGVVGKDGEIRGLGMGSWWERKERKKEEGNGAKEGDGEGEERADGRGKEGEIGAVKKERGSDESVPAA